MGNQNSHELRQAETGRVPTDSEMLVLYGLQKKALTHMTESPEHVALLRRYWDAFFGTNKHEMPEFALISPLWRLEGGFSTTSPMVDLHFLGELGLRCLVFFVETFPGEAKMMKRGRSGYPFAKAAVAVARIVCELLFIVDEELHPGKFPVTETLYWQVLKSETSFYQLFALAFVLFEQLYCEEAARNRSLQDTSVCPIVIVLQLASIVKQRLQNALLKAPSSLQDLGGLCGNGRQILLKPVCTMDSNVTKTQPVNNEKNLSRWSQHASNCKGTEALEKNWGCKQEELAKKRQSNGNGDRPRSLQPRMPEICRPSAEVNVDQVSISSESEQFTNDTISESPCADEDDLFKGLITKGCVNQYGTEPQDYEELLPARSS